MTEAPEGQPESPTAAPVPATSTASAVTEAPEGQPESPTGTTSASVAAAATYTGAANANKPAVAALVGLAALMAFA